MRILIERKVPFSMSLLIETHTLEAHSAMNDLTLDEKTEIKENLQSIFNRLEDLMRRTLIRNV